MVAAFHSVLDVVFEEYWLVPIVVGVFCCYSYQGRRILSSTTAAAVVVAMGVKSLQEEGDRMVKSICPWKFLTIRPL